MYLIFIAFQSASDEAAIEAIACHVINHNHKKPKHKHKQSSIKVKNAEREREREREREDLLDTSGIELAVFDAVGELVEGFALLL